MTLSSASRQHRKSMLPIPRLSSRINSRRAGPNDTSRIARRVPSPLLLVTPSNKGSNMQAHRHPAAASGNPQLPEFCSRRAGSPSKIPWPSGQTSLLTLEQSEVSSFISTPPMEAKSVDAQYPIPSASAEIEQELAKGQEGRTIPAQRQGTDTRDPALPPAQQPSRRPASTGLTSSTRTDSPRDGGASVLTRKKSAAVTSSVSGKENRRPKARSRVPAPPAPLASPPTIPPRSTRRPTIKQPPHDVSHSHSPHPLAIRKWPSKSLTAGPPQSDSSQVRSAPGAPGDVPTGIKTLMGDIDRFSKEWTEMFNDLSTGSDRREDEVPRLDASPMRIHPPVRPGGTSALDPAYSAIGKQTQDRLVPASLEFAAVSRSRAWTLSSADGEMIQFDVTPASLARWQHRDNAMIKDTPAEEKLKQDVPEVDSTSALDPPSDGAHQRSQNGVTRNPPLSMTHQAPRYLSPLLEMGQSPLISGSHLVVETTSVAFSKQLPEMKEHGIDTPRRNETTHNERYHHPAAMPNVSPSPFSTTVPRNSISVIKSSSPWVNLRGHDFGTPRPMRSASDVTPTRSSSLRGLRAIFKRTSADGQRQRAESLKELISEPRVLSLGSISISNLRDAGVASGRTLSDGLEGGSGTAGVLIRKPTVKW